MEHLQWSIRSILFLLLSYPAGSMSASPASMSDRLALLDFKSSISDPSGALASWGNISLPLCLWPGVTCANPHHPGRVTRLNLNSLNLTGSISPSITNLTLLTSINLSLNFLNGEIPSALSSCTFLKNIVMWGNNLQGEIPHNLSHCTHLRNIDLSENSLTGEIPWELSSLRKLQQLILYDNFLEGGVPSFLGNISSLLLLDISENPLGGVLPTSLAKLTALERLQLNDNNLTGAIPSWLGTLQNLTFLDLSRNNLVGMLPTSIWNLSLLTSLGVATNQLHGVLPPNMGQALPRLVNLYMEENQFSGSIPASLSNASSLEIIQLYINNFSGIIPSSLGTLLNLQSFLLNNNRLEANELSDWGFITSLTNCTNLKKFAFDANLLRGRLPESFANLSTTIKWLTLSENQITGTIPAKIEKLIGLTKLDISYNFFSGTIPTSIGMLQGLNVLDLSENQLSGHIPQIFGNLTQLTGLYLGNAGLSGSIPTSIKNCRYLVSLDLSRNKLTGTIPIELMTISTISRYLSFSNNSLEGSIPTQIGNMRNLNVLDLSWNKFSGKIPSSLGECQTLVNLYMEGNNFYGSIPLSMSGLKGLEELDLSHNNLSGNIPDFLVDFHDLYNLNLCNNNFEGEVPMFTNLSAICVKEGNKNLCGGGPKLNLPPCSTRLSDKHRRSHNVRLIVSIVAALFLSFILILSGATTAYWIRKSRNRQTLVLLENMKDPQIKVSYAELANATEGFAPSNLVGAGSFGSVYKGVMDFDDTSKLVAIKVIDMRQRGASKSFIAECEALRNIRHRNLVKILTCCSSIDNAGKEFKALVFEFMPSGSLESWLHPQTGGERHPMSLNIAQRLNIAIDVASALDYLHNHGDAPIVHCDLKPSNVLLDGSMIAHVADFGLATFLMEDATNSSTNLTSSIGLKGSVGYIPPEYGMANKVSTSGDVYSYGILVLEIFTGRRPIDESFEEGVSLQKFVAMAIPEQAIDIADPRLLLSDDEEEANNKKNTSMDNIGGRTIRDCLVSVLRIGLICSSESPTERMKMGDVIKELHAIRDAFLH